jgi:hypothetical protein
MALNCMLNFNTRILIQAAELDKDVGPMTMHGHQLQAPPKVARVQSSHWKPGKTIVSLVGTV